MRGARRGLVAIALGASIVGSLASGGVAAAKAPAPPAVTLAEAQHVYATTWQRFGLAFVQGQLDTLQGLATPHVLDVVAASTGCGCSWDTPHSRVDFSIPTRRGYPESFLAQIATPAPPHSIYSPFVTMVVFTKARPARPWQVAYFVRYAGTERYLTGSVVGAPRPTLFPFTDTPGKLADFFTSMVTFGAPPPGDAWTVSGSLAQELESYLNTKSDLAAEGDQQQTTFRALDKSVAFSYPKGDLFCASYESSSSVTPAPGSPPITQPSDQSAWGPDVLPGLYSSMSKLGLHDVCFSVDVVTDHHRQDTETISFQGGVYQTTGVPVSAPAVRPNATPPAPSG